MAYLLIDGYNLIGTAHRNLEKARNDIIERLGNFSKQRRHTITVVFDGWKDGQNKETKIRFKDVTAIYSRLGEKADLVIMRILTEIVKPWIVVSSDREIADFAHKKKYVCLTSEEFQDTMDFLLDENRDNELLMHTENDSVPFHRMGKSYTMPKKQRKKIQALKKL
jgi:predicted RNA-binding protein with PIN domain